VQWIADMGIDIVITHPFNDEVRTTRAADFVAQLCQHLQMRQLWGGDFALGYKREGDVPFLRALGEQKGYTVELVNSLVEYEGALVSSSRVRDCLRAGNVADVAGCLGRPYQISGIIIKGDQRGRTIGFPTANFDYWTEQLLPANGVYATYAWVGETRYRAATNVGVRPTVNGHRVTVEAHLLDFDGDLYGQTLRLEFINRVRAEKKFAGLDELKAQIDHDVQQIRSQLT
jgi:riboflavin kinase/FMN adenylyltransferase